MSSSLLKASLSVSTETRSLISGVARPCSSLTTHETFSHVHIWLIINAQQHCFFVCCKMAPRMQPDLKDNPVVLRPMVDDYQALKMADVPANKQDLIQRTTRLGCMNQKNSLWSIKQTSGPPGHTIKPSGKRTARGTSVPPICWVAVNPSGLQDNSRVV